MDPAVVRVLGLVAGLLAWAMAAAVLRLGRDRRLHAPLVVAFAAEGTMQLIANLPPSEAFPWNAAAQGLIETVAPLAFGTLPWAYLLFLTTLAAPAPGPRIRLFRAVLAVLVVGMPVLAALGLVFVGRGSEGAWWEPPFFIVNALAIIASAVAGLVIGIRLVRRSTPRTLDRRRALAVAWGFGVRDVLLATGLALILLGSVTDERSSAFAAIPLAFSTLVAVPILGHGMIRAQLFSVEARLRLQRGTLTAVSIALYVVAAQATVAALSPRIGLGSALAVAALLVLALVPAVRAAESAAARAFPATATREEAFEAYVIALAGASSREAGDLAPLRRALRLSEEDHAQAVARLRARGAEKGLLAGRFRVVRPLGSGGQADVHLCDDVLLARRVVVKTMRAGVIPDAALHEARTVAALRHPRIVTLYDIALDGRDVHLVLEAVEGESLASRLERGPLPLGALATLAADVADALAAVHAAGLVHGDVKPSNILLGAEGRAKLADFGVARLAAAGETRAEASATGIVGTLRYLAPEQARGRVATPASDQYALAATILEAATGRPLVAPRPREGSHEMLARIASGAPADIAEAPRALRPALERALASDPDARFPSVQAFAEALADEGHPP